MKVVIKLVLLCILPFLFLSACLQNTESNNQLTSHSDWNLPIEMSIEEAESKIPFKIMQSTVPFHVDKKSARILETNNAFDAVELTYEHIDEGLTVILMVTNSQASTPPNGKKGLKLANGSQTWDQGNEYVSAMCYILEERGSNLLSHFREK